MLWATIQSPLDTSSRLIPAKFSAARSPSAACSAGASCTRSPRRRNGRPVARASGSPGRARPEATVPVTMAPAPRTENARSMAKRNSRASRCMARRSAMSARWPLSAAMPRPSWQQTSTTGAPAKKEWAATARTCSRTSSTRCGATRSILLMATTPSCRPMSDRICRCSRVCGITPSSAATTSIAC